ncbi:MAG: glucose-6-phosphate isomerase [Candidatus Portnoybacteria bacterium]|nr:glucose-6-phosphate isomerase [Candidatus Portnoybacteria bacterium]
MISLQQNSGLPIILNDKGSLEFKPPLEPVLPSVRKISDMREYLANPKADFAGEDVYFMYRGVFLPQDKKKFEKLHLRYDLTILKPGLIGKEFVKTIGHFHPKKPGTETRYPEVYEVISGQALFLIQKMDEEFNQINEVYFIEAKETQKAIIPPGFGHVTCNIGKEPLVMANWVENSFESIYEPFKKFHGAAYYFTAGKDGKLEIIPNKNFPSLPEINKLEPRDLSEFGLVKSEPMYKTGQKSPDMLQFIISPELYLNKLTIDLCFKK